jgi:hypothetical protein
MNNLICDKKKKPLKSYDFKGFNSICFPAGGERGSSLNRFKPMFSMLYRTIFYRVPTRVLELSKVFYVKF